VYIFIKDMYRELYAHNSVLVIDFFYIFLSFHGFISKNNAFHIRTHEKFGRINSHSRDLVSIFL